MDTNELKQELQDRIATAKKNLKDGKSNWLNPQREELIATLEEKLKQLESK